MSRHRLVRNYDYGADLDEFEEEEYDEETYDDGFYDGTDEPAAEYTEEEERAFLEQAKATVVAMLGAENAAKIPSGKVEESILYYDYDESKAVSYLMRTFVEPPEPAGKKAKAAPQQPQGTSYCTLLCRLIVSFAHFIRFPLFHFLFVNVLWLRKRSNTFVDGRPRNKGCQAYPLYPLPPTAPSSRTDSASLAAFFSDMPWLNVPQSRMAVLVPPPQRPGGLLGGSGSAAAPKMSKLQALAAQRKRKAEEAKRSKEAGSGGGLANGEQADEDVRELRNKAAKLAIDGPAQGSPRETTSTARKATPASPPATKPSPPLPPPIEPLAVDEIRQEVSVPVKAEPAMIAQPSAFAQALFGPKKQKQRSKPLQDENETTYLAVPSLSRAPPSAFDAFLEPSPDDVVLDAQAKGWRRGQTKK